MVEPRHQAGLGQHALDGRRVPGVGVEDLDGDLDVEAQVPPPMDHPEPATSERPLEPHVGDGQLRGLGRVHHRSGSRPAGLGPPRGSAG